jgi:hypothetical protein
MALPRIDQETLTKKAPPILWKNISQLKIKLDLPKINTIICF